MKQAKLLGYLMTSTHRDAHTDPYQDHDEGTEDYIFIVELDGEYKRFEANYSYGSCGSGYCGASWGYLNTILKDTHIPTNYHTTKKDIFIDVVNNEIVTSMNESGNSWDACVNAVNSTEGEEIVHATGDGGCSYYSSGQVNVNQELFN